MDMSAFDIKFRHRDKTFMAEIRPCWREDNIVDYAVWAKGNLIFTITKQHDNNKHWVVALKNADDEFDDEMVQSIGAAIESKEDNTNDNL